MAIGLNEQELNELLSFGKTEEERIANLTNTIGTPDRESTPMASIIAGITFLLTVKISKVVTENNKRITEQLISAGIKLPI
ncbi:MAG: hypothetical protein H8E40_16375 [Chloroflexi bacterium]|nr:hypothetical protein [Chloroflexota bacterium]